MPGGTFGRRGSTSGLRGRVVWTSCVLGLRAGDGGALPVFAESEDSAQQESAPRVRGVRGFRAAGAIAVHYFRAAQLPSFRGATRRKPSERVCGLQSCSPGRTGFADCRRKERRGDNFLSPQTCSDGVVEDLLLSFAVRLLCGVDSPHSRSGPRPPQNSPHNALWKAVFPWTVFLKWLFRRNAIPIS